MTLGDKLFVGFFVFSIVFYLLTFFFKGESPDYSPRATVTAVSMTAAGSTAQEMAGDTTLVTNTTSSLTGYNFKAETARRWKLPKRLREISGLCLTADNRLLAHNDEKGTICEIDYQNGSGEIIKAFGLGDLGSVIRGDFEGIATADELIYMVTSTGRLYECREGSDGETVLFNAYATGVGRDYEIEGLAYDPDQRVLLIMSKNPLSPEQKGQLTIYRWSVDSKQLLQGGHTVVPISEFAQHLEGKKFQPSGIERHPVSGNYFVVAARQKAIAEVTPDGKVIAVVKLAADWHRQSEGITFAPDNTLIVSDEGAGKRGRLTLYPELN